MFEHRSYAARREGRTMNTNTDGVSAMSAELGGWEHLKVYGYAPGGYMNQCQRCYQVVTGVDKRATTCKPCAEDAHAVNAANEAQKRNDDPWRLGRSVGK
jgi:hypothetical protein